MALPLVAGLFAAVRAAGTKIITKPGLVRSAGNTALKWTGISAIVNAVKRPFVKTTATVVSAPAKAKAAAGTAAGVAVVGGLGYGAWKLYRRNRRR